MLQRAASNAYSWWWASHIRTTQSKWLDANLQDMENRVKIMLKLLGEEADSFGKRAEMYYQKRPEVISHVEQVYRAYRALVERYDHISKELHRANHTIATACPEEVQYAMLEEEDDNFPKAIMPINSNKIHKSTVEEIIKRRREGLSRRNRGLQLGSAPHMNKEKAEEEITRLQKAILILQTEKEFVKSSYDNGIARYWEIEKQIADMQEEICHIQDDFDAHAPIDDDEARALMMITALKSCQGTVAKLVDKFEELTRITVIEEAKTKSLRAQLYAMSGNTDMSSGEAGRQDMPVNRRVYPITQEILEFQPIYEKIENFFANTSESSAEEMAERVDELIDKVMCLELKFPKQSAQIKQLKQENENFKNKLYELQDEMALRDDPSDSNEQLKLLENELNRVRVLERSIIEDEVFVSTAFSEVFNCITGISKTLVSSGPINGNSEMVSNGVGLENITKESSLMKGEECRDIEEPSKSKSLGQGREDVSKVVDNSSSRHTGGTHDSKNGYEENPRKNCLEDLREEYSPDKTSLPEVDCTCFSGADASPDYHHTDEAKSIKKLSENGVQFNATQNIKSLNKYSKIKSSEEDSHISLGHMDNTQDMKSSILVDTYSLETRDGTSLCTPVIGSKETGGLHQQVSLVHTDSEYMASDIFHNRLEKKSSNSEEPTSRTSTLSNHGGRSQCENSTLTGGEGVTSWQNFLLDGLEGREAILLADYTSVLHNYKETKRRLAELEKKNQEHLEETKVVIRELRNANSMKYVEIRSLRNLLDSTEMPSSEADSNPTGFSSRRSFRESDISNGTLDREILTVEVTNVSHIEAPKSTSPFEVKFRNEIDALVDENLQIVVRYSMACHHMQDFHRKYQEVLNEMDNMEDKKTGESNITTESEPAEKKLRELRTELDVWFEQNALLHQEVQLKTTSLCNLQEEIAEALRASSEIDGLKFTHNLQEEIAEALRASSEIDGLKFTPFEAAKFQGEVLNMQQSNIKIESELQASQESMRELQTKVNDALRNMCESFELSSRRLSQPETESSYQNQFKHFPSKSRVPLRNFLFGTKRKKKSMFACINPTLQKQFSDL